MKSIPLNVIAIDGQSITPKVIAFCNYDVILPEKTEKGTLFNYRYYSDKEKLYMKTYEVSEDFYFVNKELTDNNDIKSELLEQLLSNISKQGDDLIEARNEVKIQGDALSGDYSLSIVPDTKDLDATSAAWTQEITITLANASGVIHSWYSGQGTVSIADTSTAGTATIDSATPSFVNGVAKVIISGDAAAWVAAEDITLTVDDLTLQGKTVIGGTAVITVI